MSLAMGLHWNSLLPPLNSLLPPRPPLTKRNGTLQTLNMLIALSIGCADVLMCSCAHVLQVDSLLRDHIEMRKC